MTSGLTPISSEGVKRSISEKRDYRPSVKEAFQRLKELAKRKPSFPLHVVHILPGNFNIRNTRGKLLYVARILRGDGADRTYDVLDILGGGKLRSASDIAFFYEPILHRNPSHLWGGKARPDSIQKSADFPYHMRQNIIRFLQDPPPKTTWQCSDFVNVVHGKFDQVERRVFDHDEWNHDPFVEGGELKNGDTIFMRNVKGDIHFAVLLSKEKGHWISKMGPAGLSISTLMELKDVYAPDEIYLISPK